MIKLISPKDNAVLSLTTKTQRKHLEREYSGKNDSGRGITEWVKPITDTYSAYAPASVYFKWKQEGEPVPMSLELSFCRCFCELCPKSAATVGNIVYDAAEEVYVVRVDNLMMGKEYFWRINDGSPDMPVHSFATKREAVRAISCPIHNVRDVGGRLTREGKHVKQGMVYRGPQLEIDDDKLPGVMNEEARRIFRDNLGIKTEIELREERVHIKESTISKDVNFVTVPFYAYGGVYSPIMKDRLHKLFDIFADESNYPIYFHCAAGADRTGTVAILLEAILGETDENIVMDYNFTALSLEQRNWNDGGDMEGFLSYMNEEFVAAGLREQLMRIIRERIEIKEETIEKIRSILLEE